LGAGLCGAIPLTRGYPQGFKHGFINAAYNSLYLEAMDAISYSTARANLAKTMDRVCEDHTALIITRKGASSVVMLSLEDYQALEETAYLLRSPGNARRLLQAVEELAAGQGQERQLIEDAKT
jgi:antitoxin YefM